MVFSFHSWYVMLGFVRNMNIFCSEDLFWFQRYWGGRFFTKTFLENAMVVQNLFSNLTLLCHICWMVCSPTLTNDWFPVILCKAWLVSHMAQKHIMSLHCSLFRSLSIYTSHNLSVYGLCVVQLTTALFTWISLTDLSRTYKECITLSLICLQINVHCIF